MHTVLNATAERYFLLRLGLFSSLLYDNHVNSSTRIGSDLRGFSRLFTHTTHQTKIPKHLRMLQEGNQTTNKAARNIHMG